MSKREINPLTAEPVALRRPRRGGAANLWLAGLLLEAARMVDEGIEPVEVEEAARATFDTERGLLERIREIGVERLVEFLDDLSTPDGPEDPFFRVYDNHFSPGEVFSRPERLFPTEKGKTVEDWMLRDFLTKRFRAVAFMIAGELIDAGLLEVEELNRAAARTLEAREGPFAMMNRLGIQKSLAVVTERMEMSHRKEINFPIPRSLLEQAQKNTPWPINNRISKE